ncbi:MAG: extracellular solute-binding protein [Ruminococcaceae bacterium]|nr:extracellular solute-binding protein [Oscillospiraceae bacterium]
MKKTLSKVLALLMLAAIMVGCFAGCGTGDNEYETLPSQEPVTDMPPTDVNYTISIMTQRHTGTTTEAEDLWFFKYMEYWFAQKGYNVDIQVTQNSDMSTQKSLLLNTNSLPDLMWSVNLKNTEIVKYAIEEGLILEWTPYINEDMMPNLTKRFADQPESKVLSTAPNNGIYGIPYYAPSQYASGCYGTSERLYFRQSWLDQAGVTNPTTKEELLNVLRAFKSKITDPSADKQDVPLVSSSSFFEKYLWTCLGFYGTEPGKFGTNLMVKNGQLTIPAYTESYKEFVSIMKTLYDEGLIAKDYFSYSDASAGALINNKQCGALSWWTLEYVGNEFSDIVCANPIPLGDVTSVEDIHVSRLKSVYPNYIWARKMVKQGEEGAEPGKDPRILAMLIDYVYSDDGAWLYRYGPEQGKDPLGLVEGWYFDENKDVTTEKVANGTYASISAYGRNELFPNDYAGLRPAVTTSGTGAMKEFTDSVTGETYTCIDNLLLTHDNNDGHWRLITIEKWSDRATSIRIPDAYLGSEDTATADDYYKAFTSWINSETIKFITGTRDISEIDQFYKELEDLHIKEYLEMMNAGQAEWLKATFGE